MIFRTGWSAGARNTLSVPAEETRRNRRTPPAPRAASTAFLTPSLSTVLGVLAAPGPHFEDEKAAVPVAQTTAGVEPGGREAKRARRVSGRAVSQEKWRRLSDWGPRVRRACKGVRSSKEGEISIIMINKGSEKIRRERKGRSGKVVSPKCEV